MITIVFTKNKHEITAQGHSEYAEEGKDIVCASVSAVFVFASNVLKEQNIKHTFGSDPRVPFIGIKTNSKKGVEIISALVNMLMLVRDEFPDFVALKEVQ